MSIRNKGKLAVAQNDDETMKNLDVNNNFDLSDKYSVDEQIDQDSVSGSEEEDDEEVGTIPPKQSAVSSSSPKMYAGRGKGKYQRVSSGKKSSGDEDKKDDDKKKRKKSKRSLDSYIFRLLKQKDPSVSISTSSMSVVNSMVMDLADNLINEMGSLLKYSKNDTLKMRDVRSALSLVVPGELCRMTISEADSSVQKYLSAIGDTELLNGKINKNNQNIVQENIINHKRTGSNKDVHNNPQKKKIPKGK